MDNFEPTGEEESENVQADLGYRVAPGHVVNEKMDFNIPSVLVGTDLGYMAEKIKKEHEEIIERRLGEIQNLELISPITHYEETPSLDHNPGLFISGIDCTLWKQDEHRYILASTFSRYTMVMQIEKDEKNSEWEIGSMSDGSELRPINLTIDHKKNRGPAGELEKWVAGFKNRDENAKAEAFNEMISMKISGFNTDDKWKSRKELANPLLFFSYYAFRRYLNQVAPYHDKRESELRKNLSL